MWFLQKSVPNIDNTHGWQCVQVKYYIISITDLLFLVEYSRNTLQEWLLVVTVKVSGFVFNCIFRENQKGRAWRASWMIRAALIGRLWGPGARSRIFLICNEKQQLVSQMKYNTCANGRFPHDLMEAWCGSVSRFRSLLFRLMSLSGQTFQSIATEQEDQQDLFAISHISALVKLRQVVFSPSLRYVNNTKLQHICVVTSAARVTRKAHNSTE